MNVAIFCHDISNNAMGRVYVLVRLLEPEHAVTVYGPAFGDGVWDALKEEKMNVIELPKNYQSLKTALDNIKADVLFAVKPRGWSMGLALWLKYWKGLPLIVDEDDYDLGFVLDLPIKERMQSLVTLRDLRSGFYTWWLSKMFFLANAVTVSSETLKKKFGGTIIPHAKPAKYYTDVDTNLVLETKKRLDLKEHVIMFQGTVRKHKGIDQIIAAIDTLGRDDVSLVIVGADDEARKLIPKRDYLHAISSTPLRDVPTYLSLASMIVLPQKKSKASDGQVPMKLFDAMAMGKVIVSTNVSDIPKILEGCGIVVEPDDVTSLSKAIAKILEDNRLATTLSKNVLTKYQEEYSEDVVKPRLIALFSSIINEG